MMMRKKKILLYFSLLVVDARFIYLSRLVNLMFTSLFRQCFYLPCLKQFFKGQFDISLDRAMAFAFLHLDRYCVSM